MCSCADQRRGAGRRLRMCGGTSRTSGMMMSGARRSAPMIAGTLSMIDATSAQGVLAARGFARDVDRQQLRDGYAAAGIEPAGAWCRVIANGGRIRRPRAIEHLGNRRDWLSRLVTG